MRAFARVLRDPALEPTSDFFAAGGDSLAAAAVAAELEVPTQLLAGFPTARTLAAHMAAYESSTTSAERSTGAKDAGVAPAQPIGVQIRRRHLGSAADGLFDAAQQRGIPRLDVTLPGHSDKDAGEHQASPVNAGFRLDPDKPALVLSRGGRCRSVGLQSEGNFEQHVSAPADGDVALASSIRTCGPTGALTRLAARLRMRSCQRRYGELLDGHLCTSFLAH